MHWNDKLASIIQKSSIFANSLIENRINEEYPQYNTEGRIIRLWDELPSDKRIAVYGNGAHTQKLFGIVNYQKKNIVCLIDNMSPKGKVYGIPVIAEEELQEFNVDTIFISVMGGKETLKKGLKTNFPDIEVIDLYEQLNLVDNENTERPFYYDLQMEMYFKLAVVKEWIKSDGTEDLYKYLIYQYLKTYSFPIAYKWMEITKILFPHLADDLDLLKLQIELLVKELSDRIKNRKNKNVALLILDCLKYTDFNENNLPFLSSFCESGLMMSRAYSHVSYTDMSFTSMLTGKQLLDNELYNIPKIEKAEFFSDLQKEGVCFKYYGISGRRFMNENIENVGRGMLSEVFWTRLCHLADSDKKDVVLLHCLETHIPYVSGEHEAFPIKNIDRFIHTAGDGAKEAVKKQMKESQMFTDEICKYYMPLLNADWIISADHGDITVDQCEDSKMRFWRESSTHVPYYVVSSNMKFDKRENSSLFSHMDTWKVLENLLEGNAPLYGIEKRDYVEAQKDLQYDEKHLFDLKKKGMLKTGAAFKCWIFEKDKFVIYQDGKEEYYLLPDDDTNLIDREEYAERIREIKDKINMKFPNFDIPRFFHSKKYYDIK